MVSQVYAEQAEWDPFDSLQPWARWSCQWRTEAVALRQPRAARQQTDGPRRPLRMRAGDAAMGGARDL